MLRESFLMSQESVISIGFYIAGGTALGASLYLLIVMNRFFSAVKAGHAEYYEKIGSPTYDIGDFRHRKAAAFFVFRLFLGIRADFPQDKALRHQMRVHQLVMYLMVIGISIGFGLIASVTG